MSRRAIGCLFSATLLLLGLLVVIPLPAAPAAHAAALTGEAVTLPSVFRLVRSNGALVTWSRYAGTATFDRYEVHRSATPGFTPSASTLLTTIRDKDVTSWQDSTAAADKSFSYKVVSAGATSNEVTLRTPLAGKARLTLQPDAREGQMARIYKNSTVTSGCGQGYYNDGASTMGRLGVSAGGLLRRVLLRFDLGDVPVGAAVSSATLTLSYRATVNPQRQVDLHRLTADWAEGTGSLECEKPGSSWFERQRGVRWAAEGGDFDPTADALVPAKPRDVAGTDSYDLKALVQEWANGTPNFGMLLKSASETPGTGDEYFDYDSDDVSTLASRPKLVLDFADGSVVRAPRATVTGPASGATVRGAVELAASASDDRRVDKVEFLVDGAVVATDTAAPWSATWTSTGTGARSITARATDDAGNVTTSAAVSVTADNTGAPSVWLDSPAVGASLADTVTVTATASAGVSRVEFYADDDLIGTDDTSPYSASWNTLDLINTAFDGDYMLTAKAYGAGGQVTTSAGRLVTVANTAGTRFQATFDLNAIGPDDDAASIPLLVTGNEYARSVDPGTATPPAGPAAASVESATGTAAASMLEAAPDDGTSYYPPPAPGGPPVTATSSFKANVSVTNTSQTNWKGGDLRLWYRWYTPDGVVLFEGQGSDYFPDPFPPGKTKLIPVTIEPPPLPLGADLSQVRLRFDLFDTAGVGAKRWYSANGNRPPDNPVLVTKDLEGALGLERFWQYDAQTVGAGTSTLTNVANGNMLLRWSPFFAPGRGLSTMVDLTYNSLEDHSDSPAGNNMSLSISGLSRLGTPIDIHPNKADEITGKSNKYVVVTDGDGTVHTFTGTTDASGVTRYTEPPGVNLYLRPIPTNPDTRRWALTRPDNVTFFYDVDGFPTAVTDRNGNTLSFTVTPTPPGEDPGGPKKRITAVTDAGNRSFTIDYYSKVEARKAHVRGNIQSIIDHSGSKLDFDYYDDGNLLRLTQRGGTSPDGGVLADRTFVFTYTTSNGAGPAIGTDDAAGTAARRNPEAKTPNQSTRIYSVIDPRGNETRFAYYSASEGSQLRWKLKSRTDRAGQITSYGYDPTNRITTVTAPMSRVTKYTYDTIGKVTQLVNPLNQTTGVQWSADYKVTRVTEPTNRYVEFTYNNNGYPLTHRNQAGEITKLVYTDSAVDPNDTGNHLSLLQTAQAPKGVATTNVFGDYQWKYTYDSAGNIDKVTDQVGAVTNYDYNLAGSANPGTISAIRDANGNPPTTFPSYDPSGQPTEIKDPLGNSTKFGYDPDGNVIWIQDPNHATESGTDERSYRTFFDYDPFGRLARQSAPKSTATEKGTLIWSGAVFDANDNLLRQVQPHYGQDIGYDPGAPAVTATYDTMDRPLIVAGPDTSVDPAGERTKYTWDAAGRLDQQQQPKGVRSTTPGDYIEDYSYDALDRVIRETTYGSDNTAAQTRKTHLCYDLAGDLRSVTSPRADLGSVTCPGNGPATASFTATYTYDEAHRQLTATDPLGHVRRTTYDGNGNVTATETDIESGRIAQTKVTYDERDLPVKSEERFDGATRYVTTMIEYDKNRNRVKVVSPRGYDTDPDGQYGPDNSYVTFMSYDGANRLTKVELPHDSRDGTERQYVHHKYDANGNLASTSLPVTAGAADAVGSLAWTEMKYYDPGWIRTSDDPTNPRVTFDYTAQGWQASRVPDVKSAAGTPDSSQRMTWTYFADGMLDTRTDTKQQASSYKYDENNNLVSGTARATGNAAEKPIDVKASYTGFNEPAKVSHRKQGTANWTFTSYGYDRNGNVTSRNENGEENDLGAQTKDPRVYTMTYDESDWLDVQLDLGTDGTATCKDDQRIDNDYFGTGWEKRRDIRRAVAGCTSSDSLAWPTRQTTTWKHFDNGKLRDLTTTAYRSDGTSYVSEDHDVGYFDASNVYVNGNRTRDSYLLERENVTGANGATSCEGTARCEATYDYDARDRLLTNQLRAGRTDTYKLDEPGNLLGDNTIRAGNVTTEVKSGVTTTKRYTANQLTEISVGGQTGKYWYDDFGNTDCLTLAVGSQADCSPSDGVLGSANLIVDYAYDYLQRLEGVRQYSGGSRTDRSIYRYDAADRLSLQEEYHSGTGNDRTTTFTYQGLSGLVTQEAQSGGTNPRTKTFSYDSYGHRLAMTDIATGAAAGTEPERFTFGHDVHSSVSQLLDQSGKVRASYGYDAYGGADAKPTEDAQALTSGDTNSLAPLNPYRYSARRMDSGTVSSAGTPSPLPNGSGGYDMGARRYGPDTASFLQQDMFAGALANLGLALDPLTQNRYALAGGNPISFIETDGHMAIADGGGGGSVTPTPTPAPGPTPTPGPTPGPTPAPTPGPTPTPGPDDDEPGLLERGLNRLGDAIDWGKDRVKDTVAFGGEVWDRGSTLAVYGWDATVRRVTNPVQTVKDVALSGGVLPMAESAVAAEAIVAEDAELKRDGPYCGKEAECLTGASTPDGADAITIGHSIRFSGDNPGDALVGHEMQHVYDIENVGGIPFYASYLGNYLGGRARGMSHDDAYRSVYWEERAYDVGDNYQQGARPRGWPW